MHPDGFDLRNIPYCQTGEQDVLYCEYCAFGVKGFERYFLNLATLMRFVFTYKWNYEYKQVYREDEHKTIILADLSSTSFGDFV